METLIVMADAPLPGFARSRLAHERSEADAQILHAAFLRDFAEVCREWRSEKIGADPNRRLVLAAAPHASDPLFAEFVGVSGARIELQPTGDWQHRLRTCLDTEFARGARAVCVVGLEAPTVPRHLLDEAFRALLWERAVLGPTFDDGLWLFGAQRSAAGGPEIMAWSTPGVLQRTLMALRRHETDVHVLPFWYSISRAIDLERLIWHIRVLRDAHPERLRHSWNALCRIGLIHDDATLAELRIAQGG